MTALLLLKNVVDVWRCIFWLFKRISSGGKNPQITLEQVADVSNMLAWKIWQRYPYSWKQKVYVCGYYQWRNKLSHESRKRKTERLRKENYGRL